MKIPLLEELKVLVVLLAVSLCLVKQSLSVVEDGVLQAVSNPLSVDNGED